MVLFLKWSGIICYKQDNMKLTRTSEIRGDETASYIVEEYKATTLGEFVEEVLKERPHEWGYISFN